MKNSRGSAYIVVVVATLAVLSIVLTALSVTAGSRRMTARYEHFFGLYDLASAGNVQAFYVIEKLFEEKRDAAMETATTSVEFTEVVAEKIRVGLEGCLCTPSCSCTPSCPHIFCYSWEIGLTFFDLPGGGEIQDTFTARTVISRRRAGSVHPPRYDGFYIQTFIEKLRDDYSYQRTRVRSRVKILDYFTIEMIELMRLGS